jgi:transcriptional regulator with XRE-family HTH domain
MFKNRIREKRQELGLSQTKLACLIGMAEPTLSDLELGKRMPWPKARRDLAKALGVREEDLFPDDFERGEQSK